VVKALSGVNKASSHLAESSEISLTVRVREWPVLSIATVERHTFDRSSYENSITSATIIRVDLPHRDHASTGNVYS
jgi:hypothetical protein